MIAARSLRGPIARSTTTWRRMADALAALAKACELLPPFLDTVRPADTEKLPGGRPAMSALPGDETGTPPAATATSSPTSAALGAPPGDWALTPPVGPHPPAPSDKDPRVELTSIGGCEL